MSDIDDLLNQVEVNALGEKSPNASFKSDDDDGGGFLSSEFNAKKNALKAKAKATAVNGIKSGVSATVKGVKDAHDSESGQEAISAVSHALSCAKGNWSKTGLLFKPILLGAFIFGAYVHHRFSEPVPSFMEVYAVVMSSQNVSAGWDPADIHHFNAYAIKGEATPENTFTDVHAVAIKGCVRVSIPDKTEQKVLPGGTTEATQGNWDCTIEYDAVNQGQPTHQVQVVQLARLTSTKDATSFYIKCVDGCSRQWVMKGYKASTP